MFAFYSISKVGIKKSIGVRYFVKLSYCGGDFHGWQRQASAYTVQQCLEDHFTTFFRQKVTFTGAGRTDTGVHARNYMAHIDLEISDDLPTIIFKLNWFLPKSIVVHDIVPVRPKAHARYDAIRRTYQYYITRSKDPFLHHLAYFYTPVLDLAAMNEAAQYLIGKHDFRSFARSGTDVNNFICDVQDAFWEEDQQQYVFTITANRFLRNMVRAVVGTLLEVGRGKLSENDLPVIMAAGDRRKAATSAPAKGLFLSQIDYADAIFEAPQKNLTR